MERDYYADIRTIAEAWFESGVSKDEILEQLEELVDNMEEETL